ncbi:ParB/RepB/Spo0J family partition protein [Bifidobacterium sp. 82T24]|uniref:ParB/RepB/Spo0J family partition protein n=1 Tax=Bifidobacterium pluvialisilvae TaxID=2834436 RepID=UPI001C593EAD|nr:ParB/RepB/Spo0J family partition protein [Bifidobacterium pluvialisilvae]MBW3088665.1 ParB/RepB/Spo0J family partition protein [Bifidobacterium pluvialisilvae]
MATRSRRLGKGLGALFPTLPGENEEKKETAPAANANDSSAERRIRPRANTSTVETGTAFAVSKANAERKKNAGEEQSDGPVRQTPHAKTTRSKSKRPSMPSLTDSLHPSDMFFGGEDSSAAGTVPASASVHSAADFTAPTGVRPEPVHDDSTPEKKDAASEPSHGAADADDASDTEMRPVAGGYLAELDIDDIVPNDHQPRHVFSEEELDELSRSIKEVGVLQPIVVRKRTQRSEETGKLVHYELIMGERRWRATRRAGLDVIPAIVKTTADDDMLRDALLENLHRVALNPLEEAAAYQQMLNEFGLTQEQLSKSVSKSRPQIANTLRLLQLPSGVQKKVSAGVLSAGHARALLSLSTPEEMEKLADRIIAEGLSVRATEEIVSLASSKRSDKKKRAKKPDIWANSPALHTLENRFDTKVAIKGTAKRGRIEISFASEEDFNRIVALLGEEGSKKPGSDGWV